MKYIGQFAIIIAVSFVGEILHALIPLPIPASIYALVIMLAALLTKIIKVQWVSETAHFLVDIMSIMFIPAAVGLIAYWDSLRPVLLPVIVVILVTTWAVMIVSGRVTQAVMRRKKPKQKEEVEEA